MRYHYIPIIMTKFKKCERTVASDDIKTLNHSFVAITGRNVSSTVILENYLAISSPFIKMCDAGRENRRHVQ